MGPARPDRARGHQPTLPRRDHNAVDQLTPQELQIATLLAAGRTTKEAAAAVFLSPKTIESHLRHVYQKLAINSREQLAQALCQPSPSSSAPPTSAADAAPGTPLVGLRAA